MHQDSTLTMPEAADDDDHSMSESRLSQDEDFAQDFVTPSTGKGHEDDLVSKSSMSSMSAFMSSLVGIHSEDWSFCLQVDNAKPRDLPPPIMPQSVSSSNAKSSSDSSAVSISRKQNGMSRWESTPSSPASNMGVEMKPRARAMRPWRPPSNNNNNKNNNGARKTDAPIVRPQRHDSNRTLNAKLPQRNDSDRCLNREMSISDLGALGGAPVNNVCHNSTVGQHSMDLRVLLEDHAEEDDLSVVGEGEAAAVYLKIPSMLASEHSLWGSASTMTASIRTMTSTRSLMSHYSKESIRNLQNYGHKCSSAGCTQLDSSHRSLFCKTEEERPIRPPRRTRSREHPFNSNVCERPVRRPVRIDSDRSMLSGSTHGTSAVAMPMPTPISVSPEPSESLLPPLNLYDSSANFSFRLIRSLSEQTMDTTWRDSKKQTEPAVVKATHSGRSLLKRTLSDSLLLFTESVSTEQTFAMLIDEDN